MLKNIWTILVIEENGMDTRESAVDLDSIKKEAFLEALIKIKARHAVGSSSGISVYDQFVALHRAVMAVNSPGVSDPVNYGHGNIAFLPWHRQYLRAFELALQQEVPGVTLPYWNWSDDVRAVTNLFTPEFLGTTTRGQPELISNSLLQRRVPIGERPNWWPAGIQGFIINGHLEEGFGDALTRGSMEVNWPPSPNQIKQLTELNISIRGAHPLWAFWLVLEQGHSAVTVRTHNSGHRFIGGHMGGAFSPNDPIFWMHHANVDRIWANWQQNRLDTVTGSTHVDHWPDSTETSPFDGRIAPLGHKLNDSMWPWVGNEMGFQTVSVSRAIQNLLPDYSVDPAVTVSDVLDFKAMNYLYTSP